MPIRRRWRIGDHLVTCDRTGRTYYASDMRREWNGLLVHKNFFEPRNPQDFVRGLVDKQHVTGNNARPPGIAQFIGPLTTEIDGDQDAGTNPITVLSSARFGSGDSVLVALNNGTMWDAIVQSVPSEATLLLATSPPWSMDDGGSVINKSAVSEASI